jgi:hypothetical protein
MSDTFNKLQVCTDISEKALQNPVNGVQLFSVQKHLDGDQKRQLELLHFFISPFRGSILVCT